MVPESPQNVFPTENIVHIHNNPSQCETVSIQVFKCTKPSVRQVYSAHLESKHSSTPRHMVRSPGWLNFIWWVLSMELALCHHYGA